MSNFLAEIAEVNKIRAKLGLDPITALEKGVTSRARSCPIALSIASGTPKTVVVGVDGTVYVFKSRVQWTDMTDNYEYEDSHPVFAQFVRDFDNNKYPELSRPEQPEDY